MNTMTHNIDVSCSTLDMFNYINKPWLWHEWHPNSVGANSTVESLSEGDCFVENFALRPVPFIPLTIRQTISYKVIKSEPGVYLELLGVMGNQWATINFCYNFDKTDTGCRFQRALSYKLHGVFKLLSIVIFKINKRVSDKAMIALKERMCF